MRHALGDGRGSAHEARDRAPRRPVPRRARHRQPDPGDARRVAAGLPPVNSVWLWGGGVLPARVACVASAVHSADADLLALAALAGARNIDAPVQGETTQPGEHRLIDLRAARDWPEIESSFLLPALDALTGDLVLDFSDGARFRVEARQKLRFWRRPLRRIEE